MKQRDRPSLRLGSELQAVVERAGDSGAAIRALMVLGAAVAGEDLAPLQQEILRLRGDDTVCGALKRALSALSDTRQTGVRHVSDTVPAPPEHLTDDPFAGVGFEV